MTLQKSSFHHSVQQNKDTSDPNTQAAYDNSKHHSFTDEWAPLEDEIGASLTQILHSRKRKAPATPEASLSPEIVMKTTKGLSDTMPTNNEVNTSAMDSVLALFDDQQEHEVVEIKPSNSTNVDPSPPAETKRTETKDGRNKNNHVSEAEDDDYDGIESGTMTFMDEESARNYQRILEEERRKQNRRKRRSWLEERRKSQNVPTPPKPAAIPREPPKTTPKQSITVRSGSDIETIESADEFPVDPLDPFGPSPKSAKRRRVVANRISDSEEADDVDALDKRVILEPRLRDKSAQQSSKSRYEQARINMKNQLYDTDTDDNVSNGTGNSFEQKAEFAPDMPETGSESEKPKKDAIFVINDSSDDDFVTDPEEPTQSKPASKSKPVPKPQDKRVAQFFSSFERQRVKPPIYSTNRKSARIVKGYSDGLDSDLDDFIADDDNEELEETANILDGTSVLRSRTGGAELREAKEELPAEFSQTDLSSSFKAYVQYLVHWICNGKEKPELDEQIAAYFFQAYKYIERTISSIEQSLTVSSVWVDIFRDSLFAYPEFHSSSIASIPGCDACHFHKNRTATSRITFKGDPYKRSCLQPPHPKDLHSDFNDESVSDTKDYRTRFNLGRSCFQRAKVCHELHHYFCHLMYSVERNLRTLTFDSKESPSVYIEDSDTESGDNSEPWGDTEPEELVQMLEKQGRMEQLFLDYKDLLDRSKNGFAS